MSKYNSKKGKSDKEKELENEVITNNSTTESAENTDSTIENKTAEPAAETEKMADPCPEISELEKLQIELAQFTILSSACLQIKHSEITLGFTLFTSIATRLSKT